MSKWANREPHTSQHTYPDWTPEVQVWSLAHLSVISSTSPLSSLSIKMDWRATWNKSIKFLSQKEHHYQFQQNTVTNVIQFRSPPHCWLLKVASATALGIVLTRVHCAFSSSSSIAAVFHRPGYVITSLLVVVPCASMSARQNQWEPSFSSRISLWFPQTKFDSRRPTY